MAGPPKNINPNARDRLKLASPSYKGVMERVLLGKLRVLAGDSERTRNPGLDALTGNTDTTATDIDAMLEAREAAAAATAAAVAAETPVPQ